MKEKKTLAINGYIGIIILILMALLGVWLFISGTGSLGGSVSVPLLVSGGVLLILSGIFASTVTIVAPNQAKIIVLFGRYLGTIRNNGMFITVPFTNKLHISLRVRNFNSSKLKVNDVDGNPIEIAAVVVFRVIDTAKAAFDVDFYEDFIEIQSETAIRHVATKYPYDSFQDTDVTLRGNSAEVSQELTEELQHRLEVAGVEIIEARLTHLAYSTEIASAMLQRQQAKAILSARQIIVEGAVGMTQLAIAQLEEEGVLKLDDERRLQLVNNLLVSIITDKGTQPVINTGDVS